MNYNNSNEQYEVSYTMRIWAAFASVGWYLLAIVISLWYASPYIRERYKHWRLKKGEQEYAAKYHKNVDLLQERLSAMEAARQKMQEEYQRKCTVAREETGQKSAQKRQSILKELHDLGEKENKINDSSSFSDKKSLKGEYNPLMGDGAKRYRPPKRSCCGKGGCG